MGENISDALKMGAAILLFVMALSVAIFAFSKARTSAEKAMEKLDGTFLYYDSDNIYLNFNDATNMNQLKIKVNQQAIVDKSQFIVNMFNYYTSGYTILFYYVDGVTKTDGADGRKIEINGDNIHELVIYYTETTSARALNRSILRVNPENYVLNSDGSAKDALVNQADEGNEYRAIYGLDITDEIARQEPWITNDAFIDKFVEDLVMAYVNSNDTTRKDKAQYYTRSSNSKLQLNEFETDPNGAYRYRFRYAYVKHTKDGKSFMEGDGRFIQRVGTYNYESSSTIHNESTLTQDEREEILSGSQFEGIDSLTAVDASEDLLSNGETLDNYSGTEKKIVQYIYIGEGKDLFN